MNELFLIISIFGLLASPASDSCIVPATVAALADHEPIFACNIFAFSAKERKRHFEELGPALRHMRKDVRELANGYEFDFPSDAKTFAMLSEWSEQERRCCPFFDIDIRINRGGGPLTLRLTGAKGTKEFIQADAGDWIRK